MEKHNQFAEERLRVKGAVYYDGKSLIEDKSLSRGANVELRRDLENKHDQYAVCVLFMGKQLGFIPREEAKRFSALVDFGLVFSAVVDVAKLRDDGIRVHLWLTLTVPPETRRMRQANDRLYFGLSYEEGKGTSGIGWIAYRSGAFQLGEVIGGRLVGPGFIRQNDGGIIKGDFRNGKLNGSGCITFPSGTVLEGSFLDNKLEGEGSRTQKDGTVLEGEFKGGELVKGIATFMSGAVWDGNFREGRLHGKGVLTESNGTVFEGEFRKGDLKLGKRTNPDGSVWEGVFQKGLLHGEGIRTDPTGTVCEGDFEAGLMTFGSMTFPDGTVFDGDFVGEALTGDGVQRWSDGRICQGDFFHGELKWGEIYFGDGRVDEGKFNDGLLHGEGRRTEADGSVIEGVFEEGLLNGPGEVRYESGAKEEGFFRAGKLHGAGVLQANNGVTYSGQFKQGEFESGTVKLPGGMVLEGDFRAGQLHGDGSQVWSDGTKATGKFRNGELTRGSVLFPSGAEAEGDFLNGVLHGAGKLTASDGKVSEGKFEHGVFCGDEKANDDQSRHFVFSVESDRYKGRLFCKSSYNPDLECIEAFIDPDADLRFGFLVSLWGDTSSYDAKANISAIVRSLYEWAESGETDPDWVLSSFLEAQRPSLQALAPYEVRVGIFDIENKQTGRGICLDSSGERYAGDFQSGERDGWGSLIAEDGVEFEGRFKNGAMDGPGELVERSGDRIEGTWFSGVLGPEVRLYDANGGLYKGVNREDRAISEGIYFFEDGRIAEGSFSVRWGCWKGSMVLPTGEKYFGSFVDYQLNGWGFFVNRQGALVFGNFSDGDLLEGSITIANADSDGLITLCSPVLQSEHMDPIVLRADLSKGHLFWANSDKPISPPRKI